MSWIFRNLDLERGPVYSEAEEELMAEMTGREKKGGIIKGEEEEG